MKLRSLSRIPLYDRYLSLRAIGLPALTVWQAITGFHGPRYRSAQLWTEPRCSKFARP